MYTEDHWDNYWQELEYFRAARIFLIICVLAPLILTAVGIVKKRLDIKRFLQGAAACIPVYAVGGGLYAFVRTVSGIRVLSWCAVIFAASCILLAVFGKLCRSNGAASFFLGMTAFSVISGTVFCLLLIGSVLYGRDPAEVNRPDSCLDQLWYFYLYAANYVDFIVSGAVKVIFMIFAVIAAEKLKYSEKLRQYIPAGFAVSAAVCCFGSGVFFSVIDEFIWYTNGLYMAAFGLSVILAFFPPLAFIIGKVWGELELKPFLKGIAIQAAVYACVVLLYAIIGYISVNAENASAGVVAAFVFLFIITALGVSFALYRAVFCECRDGNKARSVFHGANCLMFPLFLVFTVIYYNDYISNITPYKEYVDNTDYIRFMLVSAAAMIAAAASAFAVKRLHSSEKLAGKAEYISSAMTAVLCCLVLGSFVALNI